MTILLVILSIKTRIFFKADYFHYVVITLSRNNKYIK